MAHRVTLIPGDGIGPEVADAARRVAFFRGKEGEVASYVDDPLRDA